MTDIKKGERERRGSFAKREGAIEPKEKERAGGREGEKESPRRTPDGISAVRNIGKRQWRALARANESGRGATMKAGGRRTRRGGEESAVFMTRTWIPQSTCAHPTRTGERKREKEGGRQKG